MDKGALSKLIMIQNRILLANAHELFSTYRLVNLTWLKARYASLEVKLVIIHTYLQVLGSLC